MHPAIDTAAYPLYPYSMNTSTDLFAYYVYTVNAGRFALTGHRLEYGTSADEVADRIYAMGYRVVEVAPAAPVNGYTGYTYKSGDTAVRGR